MSGRYVRLALVPNMLSPLNKVITILLLLLLHYSRGVPLFASIQCHLTPDMPPVVPVAEGVEMRVDIHAVVLDIVVTGLSEHLGKTMVHEI